MAADSQSHSPSLFHNPESPIRRRLSLRNPPPKMSLDSQADSHDHCCNHDHEPPRSRHSGPGSDSQNAQSDNRSDSISISSTTKQVARTVQPFLAEHIPHQYNPLGNQPQPRRKMDASNTKYCYRHRPDLKCRRQANEPSMEQLQNELGTLSQSDQQGIAHVWSLFSAAPSKHRNLMLQGILAQCCFPQLSFVSASVRDLIKIDFLSALPPELGFKILCYLDTTSLCKAAQVSQRWRTLADDDVVWHKMCEQHIDRKCTKCGWGLPLLEAKRLRTEKRQMQLRATGRGLNEWSPAITPLTMAPEIEAPSREASAGPSGVKRSCATEPASPEESAKRPCTSSARTESESYFQPRTKRPWKDVYKDRFKVGTNWKYGRYSIKTIKGHNNGIMCLQFDDHILATGSYDATVKIWDIETGKELRTLKGHTNGVRCLQFDGDLLFSGGLDRTVRMWNWKTGALMRTLPGHTGGIITLHKSGTMLATGSMDHKVRVWNFAQKQAFCLEGHTDWVNAVKIDIASRTLFSASDDCTIRLWDLDTKQCLKVYKGHVGQVQQVLAMPPEFELDNDDPDEHSDHDHDHIHSHSQTQHDHSRDFEDAAADNASGTATPTTAYTHNHRASSRGTSTSHSSSANSAFNFGFALSHPAPVSPTSLPHFYPTEPSRPQPPRYIVTGALDGTIRLWCVASGRCLRTFFGHVEGVWALAADTLRIVSGAEDRMVKVWDPRTARCERTFTGHKGPVTCVGLSDSKLVSAGEDAEIRIMSFGGEGTEGGGPSGSGSGEAGPST